MHFFTPSTILIAAVFGFLLGSIWYSPYMFMKAWLMGQGITPKELPKRGILYMIQINVYSFIAHTALASVLALMFDLLQINSLKVAVSLGLLLTFGFIVTTHFIDMIYSVRGEHWRRENQVKFLVVSGYYLSMTAIVSSILFWLA